MRSAAVSAAIAGLLQRLSERWAYSLAQRLAGETPALRMQPSNLWLAEDAR